MDEILDKLNEEQRKPVTDTEGAVLVLAGAGKNEGFNLAHSLYSTGGEG